MLSLPPTAETSVREMLRRWEFAFRLEALVALGAWDAAAIPPTRWLTTVPELFFAFASLQRPSWGHWNGLVTALRKARSHVMSTSEADREALLVRGADLGKVLDHLDEPLAPAAIEGLRQLRTYSGGSLPNKPRRQQAFTLLISLRNRLAHDLPADPHWWEGTAAALRLLGEHLTPAERPILPVPWVVQEAGERWAFNGLRNDLLPVFTSDAGAVREEPARTEEFLTLFRRLLGKADAQERDFRQLLTRLAPDDLRGVLLGDYLMGPPVGEGGFARVHVGRQLSTGRKIALKILHDGTSELDRTRFREEATHLAKFNHPGIVQALDHGDQAWDEPRHLDLSGEAWYQELKRSGKVKTFIALEWVDGQTLDQRLTAPSGERPDVATATEWFAQAAETLATVHDAGLLHRDVTPRNLMVTSEDRVKLMDFGIARDQADAQRLRTHTGRVIGTPAYMSPEQLAAAEAGRQVGAAADIYSLCATFYEVYTGRRLYDHDTTEANTVLLQKLEGQRPTAPRSVAPEVHWQIETLLLGGLEREPADRPPSAAALAADLRRAQRNEPTDYRRPPLSRRLQLAYRRHRTLVNVSALFLLLLSLGGVVASTLLSWQRQATVQQQVRADEEEKGRKIEEVARRAAEDSAKEESEKAEKADKLAQASVRKRLYQEYATDLRAAPSFWRDGRVDLLRQMLAKFDTPGTHDPRGFEWYYWRRLAQDTLRTLTTPGPAFRVARIGGGRLFTLSENGAVRAFDLATLEERFTLPGRANCLAVTADGQWLAIANETGILLHDGAAGKEMKPLGRMLMVTCLAFSSDGSRLLAGDHGSNLSLWSIPDGKFLINLSDNRRSNRAVTIDPRLSLDKHNGAVRSVAFSPDGLWVASGGDDGTIKIWDIKEGKYAGPNRVRGTNASVEHTGPVTSLVFSPDGRTVLSGSAGIRDNLNDVQKPGEVKHWDRKTAEILQTFKRHADALPMAEGVRVRGESTVAFSTDGTRLLACADKGINVWDARSLELVDELKGAEGRVYGLAVGPGNVVVGVAADRTARLWTLGRTAPFTRLATIRAGIRGIALSPDGTTLGGTCEPGYGTLIGQGGARQTRSLYDSLKRRQWDIRSGELRPNDDKQTLPWVPREALEEVPSPDGRWLAKPGKEKSVLLISLADRKERTLVDPRPQDPPGRGSRSASADASVDKLVELSSPLILGQFSSDGRWLLGSDSRSGVALWDVESGEARILDGHVPPVRALGFRSDSARVATGDAAGIVRVWDTLTGAKLHEFGGHSREIAAVAFSPDGGRLAVAVGTVVVPSFRPGEVRLWDLETNAELLTLNVGPNYVYCGVVFSSDGRRLYASANPVQGPETGELPPGELIVWNTGEPSAPATPSPVKTVSRPAMQHVVVSGEPIFHAAFSPAGDRLAVGTAAGKVRIIDLASGATVHGWDVYAHDPVAEVKYSPGGGSLACVNWGNSEPRCVRLLNPQTGGRGAELVFGPEDRTFAAGFAPDGQRLLHLRAGPGEVRLEGAGVEGRGIAFKVEKEGWWSSRAQQYGVSPDGRWLVASGAASKSAPVEFRVWDTTTGGESRSLGQVEGLPVDLAFSPDGGFAAVSLYDRSDPLFAHSRGILVWRLTTGERIATIPADPLIAPCHIALDPEAVTLAMTVKEEGVRHVQVRLLELATGKRRTLPRQDPVRALTFSRDGRWLATVDGSVRLWDTAANQWPDVSSSQGTVRPGTLVMPPNRRSLVSLKGLGGAVQSLAFSPDGERLAVTGQYGQGSVLLTQNARKLTSFDVQVKGLALAFSHDGRVLLGYGTKDPECWDAATGKAQAPDKWPGPVLARSYSTRKKTPLALIREEPGKVYVVRGGDGSRFEVPDLSDPKPILALAPNGNWVAAAHTSEVRVYTLPVGKLARTFKTDGAIEHLTFSTDGNSLAAVINPGTTDKPRIRQIQRWEVGNGLTHSIVNLPFPPRRQIRFLAQGRMGSDVAVAVGPPLDEKSDPGAYLYTPRNGGGWFAVPCARKEAMLVAFNPDGTQLAVGDEEGGVWLTSLKFDDWAKVPELGSPSKPGAQKPPTRPGKPPTKPNTKPNTKPKGK